MIFIYSYKNYHGIKISGSFPEKYACRHPIRVMLEITDSVRLFIKYYGLSGNIAWHKYAPAPPDFPNRAMLQSVYSSAVSVYNTTTPVIL